MGGAAKECPVACLTVPAVCNGYFRAPFGICGALPSSRDLIATYRQAMEIQKIFTLLISSSTVGHDFALNKPVRYQLR